MSVPLYRRLLLLLYTVTLLLPAGFLPLQESTEARYGEIAREMVASGNYLEPVFNGIKHFHKPPLTYWLTAAGFKLFGVNDFGARFFGILAAAFAIATLYGTARIVLERESQAMAAALVGASSLLFLAVSRIVSTDIYLTCFTLLAQYFLFRQIWGRRGRVNALLYAFFLALGFLTKGPIIFLFTLLPFLVAKFLDPGHRRVFTARDVFWGTLLFAAVSLPWYLAVIARNPGLLEYFLKVQTIDRVVTNRFHRYEPPWYFLAVFFGTFLPFTFFFLRGALRPRLLSPRSRILLLYVAIPFLIFSIAESKLATYILPYYGAASIVTAEILSEQRLPRLRLAALGILILLAAAPAAGFFWAPLAPYRLILPLFCLPTLALLALAVRDRYRQRFVLWTAGVLIVASSSALTGMALADSQFRGYEGMAKAIDRIDPSRETRIVVYDDSLPSLSFYRGDLVTMALSDDRDTRFETDSNYTRTYLPHPEDLRSFLRERDRIFLVTKPKHLEDFTTGYAFGCLEVFAQRKHSAYICAKDSYAFRSEGVTRQNNR